MNRGRQRETLTVVGLPFMSETKDDVNVERVIPLEDVESSEEVVVDGDKDEGGAVVRVSCEEEVKEVRSEVGVAEERVSL